MFGVRVELGGAPPPRATDWNVSTAVLKLIESPIPASLPSESIETGTTTVPLGEPITGSTLTTRLVTGVGVALGVAVGVTVGVAVGVEVGVAVGVAVGVFVGVGVGPAIFTVKLPIGPDGTGLPSMSRTWFGCMLIT